MGKYLEKYMKPKILSIDTSCDETAAAVTQETIILSNTIWSQASAHAKFGGVMPSLAQRMHEERIDWVIDKALSQAKCSIRDIDIIAVTIGPGLSIALGVGVNKAKELAKKHKKKLIGVNHIEGHLLSPFANLKTKINLPAFGLVVSGGNTILVKTENIGVYEVLAQTNDDALGEALDKAARILGLGYPGGAILEKMAKMGEKDRYSLPIPIVGQEKRKMFTYSGIKTAINRLVALEKPLTKEKICNLAFTFQNVAFKHLTRVCSYIIDETNRQNEANNKLKTETLFVGGGVSANLELKKRLRKLAKEKKLNIYFPYSKKLTSDNAAMIGIAAYFKSKRGEFTNPEEIDRNPNLKIND